MPVRGPIGTGVPRDFGPHEHVPFFEDGPPLVPDTWASTTQNQVPLVRYAAPRSQVFGLFDPATNTFADWTPQPAASRAVPLYAAPRAVAFNVYDPATNTFADWVAQPTQSRPVPLYGPPRQWTVVAWGQSVITDQYAPGAFQGFRTPFRYQGSPSVLINVFDPALDTFADWTPQPAQSRPVALYRVTPSTVWGVFQNAAVATDSWIPGVTSRATPYYRGSYSAVLGAGDMPGGGTDWASVSQSWRAPFRYLGSPSVTVPVYAPPLAGGTDWVAPTQSRQVPFRYVGSPSVTIPAYSPFGTFADWAPAPIQTRRNALNYSTTPSVSILAFDSPAAWTPGLIKSRRALPYSTVPSLAIFGLDNPPVVSTGAPLPVAMNRRVQLAIASRSVVFFVVSVDYLPGGGGLGYEPNRAHLQRYEPGYKGRYVPGYKSTLRKQRT